jgi:predicted unusual protein kinase regulating ubiquinone biosynthesis (AarF/ABC1/UbiB family)
MAVLGMTVVSGAKLFGLKVGSILADDQQKGEKYGKFIADQVRFFADEFGKLKGSFMKVGQMISLYGEYYLPPEVNAILKTLQADSPPVKWQVMEKVITKQLGVGIFQDLEIDPVPCSAASMGQVYRARRKSDGVEIALKVQYPGVDAAIDTDLRAIQSLLSLSKLVPVTPQFDEIFREIRMMLKHEADYGRELEQLQYFRQQLAGDPRYIVPNVYPEYSTKRILAMSFEPGVAIDSSEVLAISQERRNQLGAAFVDLMYREMFDWRVVQTDCHFGNYRIRMADGTQTDKLVLYDFGAMRKLPKRYIDLFSRLVHGSLHKDFEAIVKAGLDLGFLRPEDSEDQLDLFADLCYAAVEPFGAEFQSPSLDGSDCGDNPYRWGETDLVERLSNSARDAIFAFKFRQPPREAVFLNRKFIGTYFILRKINFTFGPRLLMLKYLNGGATGEE